MQKLESQLGMPQTFRERRTYFEKPKFVRRNSSPDCETRDSCTEGRPNTCDPHFLGGAQPGEQRRPVLENSKTKQRASLKINRVARDFFLNGEEALLLTYFNMIVDCSHCLSCKTKSLVAPLRPFWCCSKPAWCTMHRLGQRAP